MKKIYLTLYRLKYFWYKFIIRNGYCGLYKKEIKNINDCGMCSVCNWTFKCEHFLNKIVG